MLPALASGPLGAWVADLGPAGDETSINLCVLCLGL